VIGGLTVGGAAGDLDALRRMFDSNGDGKLNSADARWGAFRIPVTQADGSKITRMIWLCGNAGSLIWPVLRKRKTCKIPLSAQSHSDNSTKTGVQNDEKYAKIFSNLKSR
jgi:hypothetical protein